MIYVVTSMSYGEKKIYTVNGMIYEEINMIDTFSSVTYTYRHQYDLCSQHYDFSRKNIFSQRYDLWCRNQYDLYSFQYDLQISKWFIDNSMICTDYSMIYTEKHDLYSQQYDLWRHQ